MAMHRMTPKRRAALRKAQLASARARRRAGGAVKRSYARGKAKRQAKKEQLYGSNWKSANRVQKANRINRNISRVYVGAGMGLMAYGAAMSTPAGVRYQNRQKFKQQFGKEALKAAKRKHKSNLKAQRQRRRNPGPTTMTWGPRTSGMAALPRGRGSNQKTRRRR